MTVRQRRYSKEEIARRGQELYESDITQPDNERSSMTHSLT